MSEGFTSKIMQNPRFHAVADRRNRLAWLLFGITMILYFSLILTAVLNPTALARPLWEGATATIGWPIGALVIIIPWLLTILYVRRAGADSREMSQIVNEVLK